MFQKNCPSASRSSGTGMDGSLLEKDADCTTTLMFTRNDCPTLLSLQRGNILHATEIATSFMLQRLESRKNSLRPADTAAQNSLRTSYVMLSLCFGAAHAFKCWSACLWRLTWKGRLYVGVTTSSWTGASRRGCAGSCCCTRMRLAPAPATSRCSSSMACPGKVCETASGKEASKRRVSNTPTRKPSRKQNPGVG